MKIILISTMYPPYAFGGAEAIAEALANGLATQGHEVVVISTHGPEMTQSEDELQASPQIVRFFPPSPYWLYQKDEQPRFKKLLWHIRDLWNPAAAKILKKIIAHLGPDLIHTHNIDGFSPLVWRVAKQAGVPLVHTAHDYRLACPRTNLLTGKGDVCTAPHALCRLWRRRNNKIIQDIDLLISPSQFLAAKIQEEGIFPRRISIVPNGIQFSSIEPIARPFLEPQDPVRLVSIGVLTASKGIPVLLEAMRLLPRALPVRLRIAGKGPLEAEVRAAAASDPRITYYGFVGGEEKSRFFDADLLLYTSICYENMPTTILEASSRGLGVLASNLGGAIELVDDRNGETFPAGDAKALAAAIERIVADRRRLIRFRTTAPMVTERFSLDQMALSYLQAYRSLLGTTE
jgi:glycosyltransferase involved in cell wall biosynthesis